MLRDDLAKIHAVELVPRDGAVASLMFAGEGSKTLTGELSQIRLTMVGSSTALFDAGTIAVVAR